MGRTRLIDRTLLSRHAADDTLNGINEEARNSAEWSCLAAHAREIWANESDEALDDFMFGGARSKGQPNGSSAGGFGLVSVHLAERAAE